MIFLTVFGTIAAAIVCWAGSEVARAPHHRRLLWTLAAGLMIVHSVAAFATIYGWRSDVAFAATARQTRAAIGVAVGSGIYVNYAFLLFWTADVLSWWRSPERPCVASATSSRRTCSCGSSSRS